MAVIPPHIITSDSGIISVIAMMLRYIRMSTVMGLGARRGGATVSELNFNFE